MNVLDRKLNSIGKTCFVKNYYEFKQCNNTHELAQKLLSENGKANSMNAQITRINCAKWIFENQKENEALEIILQSRVDHEIKTIARKLLQA